MKKLIAFLSILLVMLTLAGCGSSEADDHEKEFYYVPEYRDVPFDIDYISAMTASDDMLYLVGSSWEEETGEVHVDFIKYSLTDGAYQEIPIVLDETDNFMGLFFSEDNKFLALLSSYVENQTTGEYIQKYELAELGTEDGKILSRMDISEALEGLENFYIQYMVMDQKQTLYISDGNQYICVIDSQGKRAATIELNEWIEDLFIDKDDNVYVKQWGTNGREIRPVDMASKTLGDPVKAENMMRGDSYSQKCIKGTESSFLVSDSIGVYTYDLATDTAVPVFDWLDADMNSDIIDNFGRLSDGRYWVFERDWQGEEVTYSMALLTKTPAAEMPKKEELTLATMYLSQEMRRCVIDFNKSNEKYRITVKEYQSEDSEDALIQLNTDLTSGNSPDIVNLSQEINLDKYISKGVFEDLYPYMEKSGIRKEDYLTNVLEAYEEDGKLYAIIPQFIISTAIIKKELAGDATGWTLEELLETAERNNPEEMIVYADRSSVFRLLIYNNIGEYINWETAECYFDSDAFIQVLEFASKFPEEYDYESQQDGLSKRIRDGRILILENSISSVQEYQMLKGLFGEDITCIGYPNSNREGNLIRAAWGELAITAKSKNKEGAWEFIKDFMGEEYQDSLLDEAGSWGFPILKSSLEKQFVQDMTPQYYEDENGNKQESSKTSWGYDDFQMEIYAATQEEIENVREVLENAGGRSTSADEELMQIISEETEAYFKGQKSAKETADIIQNRAKIYVSENS